MDNEKIKEFLLPILILVVALVSVIMLSSHIITNVQEGISAKETYSSNKTKLEQAQKKLEEYKKKAEEEAQKAKEMESKVSDLKPFYKPVMTGLDTEGVIAGEFAEVLELIRANKIKVRSIKYDYDPQDDNFVKGANSKYNVARLNMEMVANYTDYDNFLKELYKHEHFLDLQSVEIVPYKKNKSILLVNFKLKLYAMK